MVHVFKDDDLQMNWETIQEDYEITDYRVYPEQEAILEVLMERIDYSDFNEWEGEDEDFDWSDTNEFIYDKIVKELNLEN